MRYALTGSDRRLAQSSRAQQHGRGAIGQRRAVAGRQRAGGAAVEHGLELRELLQARVGAHVVVALDALKLDDAGRRRNPRRRPSQRSDGSSSASSILLSARDLPLLRRDLHALAHRELRARLDDSREHGLEVPRPQLEPRLEARAERAAARALSSNVRYASG